ncbi:MAG: hypothetical protein ACJAXL_001249 [Alphaproteobacteria bacterium]|jgi:hypothetical protein
MVALNEYIQKSANDMANDYFKKNKDVFRISQEGELKTLHKQIKIEYTNILNMIVNVVAMVSYMDEERALGLDKKNLQDLAAPAA